MMLDLTSIIKPTLTVKISEEITVNVYPASKKTIDNLANIVQTPENLYDITAELLSANKENRIITVKDIEHLDLSVVKILYDAYMKFIAGEQVENNPN